MMSYQAWIKKVDSYIQDIFGEDFGVDWLKRVSEVDLEIQAFYCIDDCTLNKILRLRRLLLKKGKKPKYIPVHWYPEKVSDKCLRRQPEQ